VDICTTKYVRMNKSTLHIDVKCTFLKISAGQKVVGQTSCLAHWEQKMAPIGSAANELYSFSVFIVVVVVVITFIMIIMFTYYYY